MATDERALTCKELVEKVTDYLEGALCSEDKERFESHLALCDGCRAYLQQMCKTIQSVGNLGDDSVSSQVQERLLRVFRNWKNRT